MGGDSMKPLFSSTLRGRSCDGAAGVAGACWGSRQATGTGELEGPGETSQGWVPVWRPLCGLWPWLCKAQDHEAGKISPTRGRHLTWEEGKELLASAEVMGT